MFDVVVHDHHGHRGEACTYLADGPNTLATHLLHVCKDVFYPRPYFGDVVVSPLLAFRERMVTASRVSAKKPSPAPVAVVRHIPEHETCRSDSDLPDAHACRTQKGRMRNREYSQKVTNGSADCGTVHWALTLDASRQLHYRANYPKTMDPPGGLSSPWRAVTAFLD